MSKETAASIVKDENYEYGFHDDVKPVYSTGRGLTEEIIRQISAEKHEPQWMLDYRLKAYHIYKKLDMPKFGPDLSGLDLKDMLYYQKMTDKKFRDWKDVPEDLKKTFDRLGFPKPNVNTWRGPRHSTSLRWFIIT